MTDQEVLQELNTPVQYLLHSIAFLFGIYFLLKAFLVNPDKAIEIAYGDNILFRCPGYKFRLILISFSNWFIWPALVYYLVTTEKINVRIAYYSHYTGLVFLILGLTGIIYYFLRTVRENFKGF